MIDLVFSAADQLLLVMMKLRLATAHKDLTYRFGTRLLGYKNFHHWIDIISCQENCNSLFHGQILN